MRAAMLMLALFALNACSSNAIVKASFNSNTVVPPPPGTVSGAQAIVRVQSTASAAAAFAGMLFFAAALGAEDLDNPRRFSSYSDFADWFRGTPRAELDPTRPVQEQDCTRPVELSGNLKCR